MLKPDIDLEAEYNNRARVPDHADHIAGWHRDAAAYRAMAHCELDLAYGPGVRHSLDLFHPQGGDAGGPVVLFIHGGYWQAFDKSSFSHLARGANERGLSVAIPSYDLAPEASLGHIVFAIEAAADFIIERTGRPIVASGHSAGGHLAACLMVRDHDESRRPIRAAMPISGLFDLASLVSTSVNRALGLSNEEARRLSPIHRQPANRGRVVAVVGADESYEYRRQSMDLASVWSTSLATSLYCVPHAHHFNVIAGLADPSDTLVDTLVSLAADA
jgi:arylformamidase